MMHQGEKFTMSLCFQLKMPLVRSEKYILFSRFHKIGRKTTNWDKLYHAQTKNYKEWNTPSRYTNWNSFCMEMPDQTASSYKKNQICDYIWTYIRVKDYLIKLLKSPRRDNVKAFAQFETNRRWLFSLYKYLRRRQLLQLI